MTLKQTRIEITPEFEAIQQELENGSDHLFITGRAGTGKSTLLQYFRSNSRKKMVVLAPTGVAALNVQGQTIHSFFGFSPQITPEQAKKEHPDENSKKLIDELEMIIIDEASMLRADLLDAIDQALRQYGAANLPFGGKRLIFIGDLYQLPPVVDREERFEFEENYPSPYFFDAKVFQECNIQLLQLEKIYRQQDQDFIQLLNAIRDNSITGNQLHQLNQQHNPHYQAFAKKNEITLCTTNATANRINQEQLEQIKGKKLSFSGQTKGEFIRQLPTDETLDLKVGAQIMLVNNDSHKRWVNGSTGIVIDAKWSEEEECDVLLVKLSDGNTVEVLPYTWETNQYFYNEEADAIEIETMGSFTQYPLKLAWAVTIHKSQGKTFDNVVLDIGRGTFAHGQVYVALSRCTSLEGIVLRQPLQAHHIWCDQQVQAFLHAHSNGDEYHRMTTTEKRNLLQKCIDHESIVQMSYLTSKGQTIHPKGMPLWLGEMEYNGNEYLAVELQDFETGQSRSYSLKRIVTVRQNHESQQLPSLTTRH